MVFELDDVMCSRLTVQPIPATSVSLGRPVAGLVEIAECRCFNLRNAGGSHGTGSPKWCIKQTVRKPKKIRLVKCFEACLSQVSI